MSHITKLTGQINPLFNLVLDEELARALLFLAEREEAVLKGLYTNHEINAVGVAENDIRRLFGCVRNDFHQAFVNIETARVALTQEIELR